MRQVEIFWKEQWKQEFIECNLFYSFDFESCNCCSQKDKIKLQ